MPVLSKEYLQDKLLPDLRKIAKKLEIKNYSKLKKSEIITMILRHPFNKSGSTEIVFRKTDIETSPEKSSPQKKSSPKKKKSTPKKKKSTPKKKKSTPKKKKSSPKKKKSSPKKKKSSPGFFDKVKQFFSPAQEEQKKKVAKKKKTPTKKAAKAEKVPKTPKSTKPKAIKKTPKPVGKVAGKRRVSKQRLSSKEKVEKKIENIIENPPRLRKPIVIQQLEGEPKAALPAVPATKSLVSRKLPKLDKPIVIEEVQKEKITVKPRKQSPKKAKTVKVKASKELIESVKPVLLKKRAKPVLEEETEVVINPKQKTIKAKKVKKIDIDLPSGKKASVLDYPSLPKSKSPSRTQLAKNLRENIENINDEDYFKIKGKGKKRTSKPKKTIRKKKSSTVY